MKNVTRVLTPESLEQTFRETRLGLRYIFRFLRFPRARNRAFGRQIVQASWRRPDPPTFSTFGEADFELESLVTDHVRFGRSQVSNTPLYEFVRSHVHGIGSKEPYRKHLALRFGYGEEKIDKRVTKFEHLIDLYTRDNVRFKAVVRLTSADEAVVVDGAHRAAIVHAVGREDVIRCLVVFRILGNGKRVAHESG